MKSRLKVLLVEDNAGDTDLVREHLSQARHTVFEVECVQRLGAALAVLEQGGIDVVLLDLGLPDSSGLETLSRLLAAAPKTVTVVLTGLDDELTGLNAVKMGAQDYLLKDHLGRQVLIRTILHSIERKRFQNELWDSEERFRQLFEQSPFGVAVLDLNYHWIRVNPKLCEMVGYDQDELAKLTFADITHPDDVDADLNLVEKVLSHEIPVARTEKRYIKKNGDVLWIDLTGSVIRDEAGKPLFLLGIIEDITERKQFESSLVESEKKYRTLFDTAPVGIAMGSPDGTLVDANQALLDLLGFTREEALKIDIRNVYANTTDRDKFRDIVERQGWVTDFPVRLRKKDGSELDCLLTSSVLRGNDGVIVAYQSIIQDITEQKRLQKQLAQSQKMEAIGTLAGGVAHDFNNLLTVTSGYAEILLQSKEQNDPDYEDLQKIFHASKRGAELVRNLLIFSRRSDSMPRPINLNYEVEQTKSILERTIPKMIEIRLDLDRHLRTINADSGQIEQVLINLAVNARDAMPDGGIFTIRTENATLDEAYTRSQFQLEPGEYVILSVSDTGHGMEKETLDHIFEPFFTTKEAGKGTGLGLATVYGIVKQHGGHITCYSEPGEGTTFRIYLPIIEREMSRDATTTGDMPAFGTETILLVDDEDFVRDLGTRILFRHGYNVLTAANGREAIDIYWSRKDEISLIVLDWIMPTMGGRQCLEEIREINPEAKVLIASGHMSGGTATDAGRRGAKGFITKPYNVKQLLKIVREVLDQN